MGGNFNWDLFLPITHTGPLGHCAIQLGVSIIFLVKLVKLCGFFVGSKNTFDSIKTFGSINTLDDFLAVSPGDFLSKSRSNRAMRRCLWEMWQEWGWNVVHGP